MRLGKNKKKQWRRCVPEIEDEIKKASEVNQIDDISFDVSTKTTAGLGKSLKYSTVPRRVIRRPRVLNPGKEVIDIWADDYSSPITSKRRKELVNGIERYKKPSNVIHPGTSYQPLEAEHIDLLQKLQADHEKKTVALRKAEKKMEISEENESVEKDPVEEEAIEESDFVKDPLKIVKSTTRKHKNRRNRNINQEKLLNLTKKKEKSDAHFLRNIPKLKKQLLKTLEVQSLKRKDRELKSETDKEMKAEEKALGKVSFLLPSEVPTCLRKLVPDGDIFCDITEKFDVHKFKVDKRKKQKKLTKSVKKNGLVK